MYKRQLLADVHQRLVEAISKGVTREQFIKDLRPVLEKAGWWGRKVQTDPVTGVASEVQLGSPRRLRTIYDRRLQRAGRLVVGHDRLCAEPAQGEGRTLHRQERPGGNACLSEEMKKPGLDRPGSVSPSGAPGPWLDCATGRI